MNKQGSMPFGGTHAIIWGSLLGWAIFSLEPGGPGVSNFFNAKFKLPFTPPDPETRNRHDQGPESEPKLFMIAPDPDLSLENETFR